VPACLDPLEAVGARGVGDGRRGRVAVGDVQGQRQVGDRPAVVGDRAGQRAVRVDREVDPLL
jgi:hypothetical protein